MIVFNQIKILLIIFCAILFSEQSVGQYSYFGRTSDLASGHPVGNVTITHKRLGTEIVSDANGAFSWNFDVSDKEPKFQIVFNMFFAPPQ
jgi:hypothetical protein